MKKLFQLAAVAAVLISTGAQAHRFTDIIESWVVRSNQAAETIRAIGCNMQDNSHMEVCKYAKTAEVASKLLLAIPATATDEEAKKQFVLISDVIGLTEDEALHIQDFKKLNGNKDKGALLGTGLTSLMNLSGEIGGTGLGDINK